MTDAQRAAIADYRANGYGYKKISQLIGVSENTVKSFCRRSEAEAATPEVRVEKTCLFCGKTVPQTPGRKEKKFCSDFCRNRWWNGNLDLVNRRAMYEFVCPTCGKPFTAYGNRNRKYCSHACYIEDRFGGAV